jgi:hypothetical protein
MTSAERRTPQRPLFSALNVWRSPFIARGRCCVLRRSPFADKHSPFSAFSRVFGVPGAFTATPTLLPCSKMNDDLTVLDLDGLQARKEGVTFR